MAIADLDHWNKKYAVSAERMSTPAVPERFEPFSALLSAASTALEIACGAGEFAVWLAANGVHVVAYDIAPNAVAQAQGLAERHGVAERCEFAVADFDQGLPQGDPVDLVICNMFRDARLDDAIMARLRPGGALAIAALSEVGAQPGRYRVAPGELRQAFAELDIVTAEEADGVAWLVATKR